MCVCRNRLLTSSGFKEEETTIICVCPTLAKVLFNTYFSIEPCGVILIDLLCVSGLCI